MTGIRLASLALFMVGALLLLAACQGRASEPVTLYSSSEFDIPTLDPQIAQDVVSIDAIENLFVQLTNYDPQTAQIVPEAATDWKISDDGRVYTFTVRSDIPWVTHDPNSSKTSKALDPHGNPRYLSAYDFVFGVKRACDPNTGSYYSAVVAGV